eukprot:scaffold288086_cov53-Prasinocladus_malaysianus.AAC.1
MSAEHINLVHAANDLRSPNALSNPGKALVTEPHDAQPFRTLLAHNSTLSPAVHKCLYLAA